MEFHSLRTAAPVSIERGLFRAHASLINVFPCSSVDRYKPYVRFARLFLRGDHMHPNDDFLSAPELDYDGFRAAMREDWGWFTPARETNIFAGRVRTRRVFGFAAVDLTCNAARLERTELDIRRDDMEYYFVTVRDAGESTVIHNDRVVNITAGDVILLDSTRPLTFISTAQPGCGQWLGLQVPRQMLASHLGCEPQG